MQSPFPGMDPYLEHPALWPDVHNRLIAALAGDLSERVAPRYYVGLEGRTYLLKAEDLVFVGRPDLAVAPVSDTPIPPLQPAPASAVVLAVDVPMQDEVSENFLEIHNRILHDLYRRARFDLRLDYTQPPVPPLSEPDTAWARDLTRAHGSRR